MDDMTHSANDKRRKPDWGKRTIGSLAILLVVAVIVFLGMTIIAAKNALWAENGLHAIRLVVNVTHEFVRKSGGQWPRSWDDLEKTKPQMDWPSEWPKNSKQVQKYVFVNFEADPDELAGQTVEQFEAIRPIGSYFPLKDQHGEVTGLIGLLKKTRKNHPVAETE